MAKQRRYSGDETAETLQNWKKDQKSAERLAGCVLQIENYSEIDPSHPLGGRDGKKDLLCKKGNKKYIVGVYFPRTQQTYNSISKKLLQDNAGVDTNNVDALIFFTNQHLTVTEKKKLIALSKNSFTEIYHLEKITSILNAPVSYGVRLEFLDIELSKTEQLAYFAHKDKEFTNLQKQLLDLLNHLRETAKTENIPTEKIQEFKNTLEGIVGHSSSFFLYGNSMIDRLKVPLDDLEEFRNKLSLLTDTGLFWGSSPLQKLYVPLKELEEFENKLNILTNAGLFWGSSPLQKLYVPIKELEEFENKLSLLTGTGFFGSSTLQKLYVPLKDLEEYSLKLDEVIDKLKQIEKLKIRAKIK